MLGDGRGIWTFLHISDVAAFYRLLLECHLSRNEIETGKKGYYFLEAGETTRSEISQRIAQAGRALGQWRSEELKSISLQQMADALGVPFLNASMIKVI